MRNTNLFEFLILALFFLQYVSSFQFSHQRNVLLYKNECSVIKSITFNTRRKGRTSDFLYRRYGSSDGNQQPQQDFSSEELAVLEDPPDDVLAELEASQPSTWAIMKELLGINIFTYVLAGLIVIFLSLNVVLGPGWLGNGIGLSGSGTMNTISDKIPEVVDLGAPDYILR